MLKLYPLYSGSSGNMYLIKSPKSTVIVDIGVSFKNLNESLEKLDISLSDVSALLITHEHSDHTKGLFTFINKTDIPIFLTSGTWNYLYKNNSVKLKKEPNIFEVKPEKSFSIEDISITPFRTSHDAVDSVGYTFSCKDNSITIATDLGYVSDDVLRHLEDSDLNVIEANYDENLLMYGPYTYPLKRRIKSNIGHLSNDDSADTILKLADSGKRDFILGHISKNNNDPEQALYTVKSNLESNGYNLNDFNINVATRDVSYEVYEL